MKHVVVVEDDPHNAIVFRKILEKRAGCRVTLAESPEALFREAAGGPVDLVIMDVSLAHARWRGRSVSGIDLCRLLREDPRSARIPIVLATAHAMRGDGERLLAESGADDYVAKPIVDHEAFVRQVRVLLQEAA
ncbi:MAG TPA: response regulator [Candidatus Eisenbacteria bacterium]